MRRDFLQRTQICGSIPEFLSGLPPKTIVAEDARRDEGGAARIHVDAARAHEDALVVALNVFSRAKQRSPSAWRGRWGRCRRSFEIG